MKYLIKSVVASALLLCTSASAMAMNVYRPGTDGSKIYSVIEPYLPAGMTALILEHDDPHAFIREMDEQAKKQAGVTQETLDHFIRRMAEQDPHTKDFIAYAITGAAVPGNEPKVRLCAIVMMRVKAQDWAGALSHEALHCRNSQIRDTQDYWDYLRPIWKSEAPTISWESFTGFVDESLVAGLQASFYGKSKQAEPPYYVQLFANSKNSPGNSIGRRTARNVIQKCFVEKSCPTDSNEMLHMLMDDQALRADLIKDLLDLRG